MKEATLRPVYYAHLLDAREPLNAKLPIEFVWLSDKTGSQPRAIKSMTIYLITSHLMNFNLLLPRVCLAILILVTEKIIGNKKYVYKLSF